LGTDVLCVSGGSAVSKDGSVGAEALPRPTCSAANSPISFS
jgi:hypothetical protein